MITSLSLKNFKAATASYEFSSGNLILGENFAGKSAIDQAIRCLVLGYVPGVAKTAAGIKMFASAYPMEIAANVSMADRYEKPSIVFERVKSTVKQTKDDTLAAFIDEPTKVLLDPTIFFGLSDSARISKACELVRSAGMNPEDIEKALTAQIGENPSLLKHLATWRTKIKATAPTVPDLLSSSEDFWEGERKIVNAEKKRMQSTVEGVSDLNAADATPLPARELVEEAKAKAVAELRTVRDSLAAAKALAQAIAADEKRVGELLPIAATVEQLRLDVAALQEKLDALENEIGPANQAAVRAQLHLDEARRTSASSAATKKRVEELTTKAALLASIEKSVAETDAAITELRAKANALRAAANEADAKAKSAHADAASAKPEQATTGELRTDDFETNAVVGTRYLATATIQLVQIGDETVPQIVSIEDWKQLIENADEIEDAARAEEYETAQRLAELDETAFEAAGLADDAEAQLANECSQLAELTLALNDAKVAKSILDTIPTEESAPVDVAGAEATHKTAAARAGALRVEGRNISTALSAKRDAQSKAESAATELSALNDKIAAREKGNGAIDTAALTQTEAQLVTSVQGHDVTLQKIAAAEQDQKRIADAAKRRAEVEADSKLLGKVIEVITQKKTELVSVSIEAPLAVANKLAAGILKGPLVFEEGEIGMRIGDSFVSARVFSGTETAIVMMGLTAGLAAKSPLRVLLLDEIGRLTTKNAVALLTNLRSMVADGDIDQFFLIGPSNDLLADVCRNNGVNVIAL